MTTTYKKLLLLAALPALMLASCSRDDMGADDPGTDGTGIRFRMELTPMQAAAHSGPQTRVATDNLYKSAWEDGDTIGLYAAEHGERLTATDNPIHNARLVYSSAGGGSWTPDPSPLTWPDGATKLDFFAYYPYDAAATNPTGMAFKVKTDQSATTAGKSNFSLSDILMATAGKGGTGFGQGEVVPLSFDHQMAMIEVKVNKTMLGNYPPEALDVWLDGGYTTLTIDINSGKMNVLIEERIKMYPCPLDDGGGTFAYRALMPADENGSVSIPSGTVMFRFEHNGTDLLRSKPLVDDLHLFSGEVHTFEINFPFTSVTVSSSERLADLMTREQLDAVTHLKVLGEMTVADFYTMRDEMPALTSVDLGGATVKEKRIPGDAFLDKTGLQEFVFPQGITEIGGYAFKGCTGLTGSLTIPAGVTTIGNSAFSGCSSLTGTLTIPTSVTTIGERAFYRCSSLNGTLTIPAGVTTIGEGTFDGCSSLTGSLNIPAGVKAISQYAFFGCSSLNGTLTIPAGVTTIGNSAFSGCSSLTGSLTLPASVTAIGDGAFLGCSSLTGSLNIPAGVKAISQYAFFGCSSLNGTLTIPASVKTIDNSAFSGCSNLTGSLTIPAGVTAIGNSAFYGCSSLTGSLNIPTGVKAISQYAFYGCSSLNGTLTIPASVTEIGESAFYGCSSLNGSLNIPASVTTIGASAFFGCSSLNGTLSIPAGVKTIGRIAFNGCSSLTGSLTLPASVTTIGESAFYGCSSLTGSLTIPTGVTEIGNSAFSECSSLDGTLTIPESVTAIGTAAFYGCSSLASITCHIPDPTKVTFGSNVFTDVPTGTPVHVPAEAVDTYKQHPSWQQFTNISAIVP